MNNFWIDIWKGITCQIQTHSFLPQETILWFTYDNYDIAVLANSIQEVGFTLTVL